MKGRFENSSEFTKLGLTALIVTGCMLGAILLSGIYTLTGRTEDEITNLQIMLLIQNALLFILAPFIAQYLLWKEPTTKVLNFKKPPLITLGIAILALVSISPFIDFLSTWNQSLHLPPALDKIEQWMIDFEAQAERITRQLLSVDTPFGFILNLFIIAIMAGVGEELLFRGILQRLFIQWTKNIHWGVLITAFIFSAIHFQFFGFFPRMLLGVMLGYLYIWSGSIWVPIIAHTLNNALVILFTENAFNQGNKWVQYINETNNSPYLTAGSFLLAAVCMAIAYRQRKKKHN